MTERPDPTVAGLAGRLRLWVVLGVVAAAYVGAPQAGLVWDDIALVRDNRVLDNPTLVSVWLRDLWYSTGTTTTGYHRPLLTVSFLLDDALFGRDPGWFHLSSVLWHLLVVGLVAAVLRDRVGPLRANVAALAFGLHPIQSEAVMWISARNDLMAAAGILGTLLALDRKRPALAFLTALAACLSKENGYLLPIFLGLWRSAWGERVTRAEVAAVGLGLAAALALRMNATLAPPGPVHGELTAWSGLSGVVTMLGWVTWPWPLTSTATVFMPGPQAAAWPAAAATVALVAILLRFGGARAFWLLALGVAVLAPAAFGVRYYGTFGERYLYLPMFGLVAAAAASLPPVRWAGYAIAGMVATSLAVLHVRVPEWADEETLFSAAVVRAPDAYAWNQLGIELGRQQRSAEAVAALDRATALVPMQPASCGNVISAGHAVLRDADFVKFSRLWAQRGCKGRFGFDGRRAYALAQRGYWEEAAVVAYDAVLNDLPARRDEIVRAAVEARDGDLLAFGGRATIWHGGSADLVDKVASLLLARPYGLEDDAPSTTGAAGSEPSPVAAPTPPVYPSGPSESP